MVILPATEADLQAVIELVAQGRAALARQGVDQWQDGYPSPETVRRDLLRGDGRIVRIDGAAAAYAAFFITGLCASAMMPFFFAMPVQIKEIGPKYAGTATGLIFTIELLGPTLLPSYVLVPLCTGETGVDFVKFFFGIGIIFVILFVITALLPETGIKAAGKKS